MNSLDAQIKRALSADVPAAPANHRDVCDAIFAASAPYGDPVDAWIKGEIVLPAGAWEAMEETLMARIADAGRPGRGGLYAWPLFAIVSSLAAGRKGAATVVCAALLFGIVSFFTLAGRATVGSLATVMARAWGSDFRSDLAELPPGVSGLESRAGGGMSFVNSAGAVALCDDASLSIGRATKRVVEYRVFSAHRGRGGTVAFSVEKRKRGQRFTVATPYYNIHVAGTRFVCQQDTSGAVKTLLSEGAIRVESPLLGTIELCAGQGFAADSSGRQWRIDSFPDTAGATVAAGDLSLSQVAAGCRLVVQSTPAGAQVLINGAYRGITPYAMIGPRGLCTLSLRSDRLRTADTVVRLGDTPLVITIALDSSRAQAGVADSTGAAAVPLHETARRQAMPAADGPADVPALVRRLLDSAQLCESSNPAIALALYRKLADDPATPPLYRQTALFSLGRLTADRFRDTAGAAKSFGTYCHMFPEGMFAGEALLRLAELELKRNPPAAVEFFCRFLAVTPSHPRRADAAYHLGLLLQQHNNFREAIRMYQLALEQLGDNADDRRKEIRQMIATAQAAQQQPFPENRDTKGTAR